MDPLPQPHRERWGAKRARERQLARRFAIASWTIGWALILVVVAIESWRWAVIILAVWLIFAGHRAAEMGKD